MVKTGGEWSKKLVGGQKSWLVVQNGWLVVEMSGEWSKRAVGGQNELLVVKKVGWWSKKELLVVKKVGR